MKTGICYSCLQESTNSFCYSCSQSLFDGRKVSHRLAFTLPEFTDLKLKAAHRISISGVQLKHSLTLKKNKLILTESGGQYILKPVPHGSFLHLNEVPANEHLTMRLAKQVFSINTAANTFVYFADGNPAYLTRRFDISAEGKKLTVEDFAQISQKTEETDGAEYKYQLSYEEIALLIRRHVSAAELELEKLFTLVLFNYIFSNGDAHLKNFSLYRNTEYGDYLLTPAYDLVCTRIHSTYESDMALSLFADNFESEGYKAGSKYTTEDFIEFGKRLKITETKISQIISNFIRNQNKVPAFVEKSFLSPALKKEYLNHFEDKMSRIR